jgi:quercetin dioxygenase-like cupin family protein
MQYRWTWRRFAFGSAALLLACGDSKRAPTEASRAGTAAPAMHSMDHMAGTTTLTPADTTPFTYRAPLAPFRIQQPGLTIQSTGTADIVWQQSIFTPGAGPWHYHPGPSFIYVTQGRIRLERVTSRGTCELTKVYQPGDGYFEVGNQVHRAIVLGSQSAVLVVTRFGVPVGGSFTIPAADPGC